MQSMQFNVIFAVILAGGWLSGKLFARARLPAILGMVVFGIFCSVALKDATPAVLWELNPYLKSFALIVILLRAGLGISRSTLKKVGLTSFLMSWVPCVFETIALTVLFRTLFGFDWSVAGLTAAMLAAVSPAVVVPSMLDLKSRRRGEKNEVPTIIMAGASVDDVFAITMFSVFLGLAAGGASSVGTGSVAGAPSSASGAPASATGGPSSGALWQAVLSVPLSIGIGIGTGAIVGFVLLLVFRRHYATIRATEKALILLVCATLLVQVGDSFHFAALLGIMTIGFVLLERCEEVARELASKLSKIWVFAEIILFVMIGFSLEPSAAFEAGFRGLLAISGGLVIRSLGVWVATAFSPLTVRERLFCAIAYLPKATVQAALGGVALSRGIPEGQTILAIAVLAILFTAPLGLLGIRFFGNRLLEADGDEAFPLGQ